MNSFRLFAGTEREDEANRLAGRIRELTRFLVTDLDASVTARCDGVVAYQHSCHGLRGLGLDETADRLLADIQVLAADSLEGRAPGTPGEEKTVRFLAAQFRAAGLAPGNPDGTYTQAVEMVGITGTAAANVTIGTTPVPLAFGDDYVLSSRRTVPEVVVPPSEIVYATFADFRESGRLGCADCWLTFEAPLRVLLRRYHGSTAHHGRRESGSGPPNRPVEELARELREQLRLAVESENFELAAELRDRLKELT